MLFVYRPETPLQETLRFLTDVLIHKDGTEQRICLRIAARTEYAGDVLVEDGPERQRIENILFDQQASTFEIPAWVDGCYLGNATAAGATMLNTDTTMSIFRNGAKAILISPDDGTYEIVTVVDVDGDHLETSATTLDWPAMTEIYPIRNALLTQQVRSQRWTNSLTKYTFNFALLDDTQNLYQYTPAALDFDEIGFGDDAAKLLVDDPNAVEDRLTESSDRMVSIIDNATGKFSIFSNWPKSRRSSSKGFVTTSRQKLWAAKVWLSYLNGRQTSFLLPTFASDITPLAGLVEDATTLLVANAGHSTYTALGVNPRKYIRVELANGTATYHQVTNVVEVNAVQETITVTPAWPDSVSLSNIVRISVVEKVRLDSDDITITHADLNGTATINMPVKAVLE
jgi:hypothetical protein